MGCARDSIRYTRDPTFPSEVAMSKACLRLAGLMIALCVAAPLSGQSCGEWSWINPLPQGNALSAVAYGAGRFVAVGRAGTILVRPDGGAWEVRTSALTAEDLADVLWNG